MSNFIDNVIDNLLKTRPTEGNRFKSIGSNSRDKVPMTIAGVEGTVSFYSETASERSRVYIPKFVWTSVTRQCEKRGFTGNWQIELRYDNSLGNGRNEFHFAIKTYADWINAWHSNIDYFKTVFPEFVELMQWSDCHSQVEELAGNFVYHFNDRDFNGCKAGERKQMLAGGNPDTPMWRLKVLPASVQGKVAGAFKNDKLTTEGNYSTYHLGEIICFKDGEQPPVPTLVWEPVYHSYKNEKTGEYDTTGKERDIEAALRCGHWPDCPVEELMQLDKDGLTARYLEMAPVIRKRFFQALHDAGIPLSMDDPLWPGQSR